MAKDYITSYNISNRGTQIQLQMNVFSFESYENHNSLLRLQWWLRKTIIFEYVLHRGERQTGTICYMFSRDPRQLLQFM